MTKIAIGRLETPTPPTDISQNVSIDHYISTEEYETLVKEIEKIEIFMRDTQLYGTVVANYSEFFATLNAHIVAHKSRNVEFIIGNPVVEQLNQRILNFLSLFRSYLDFMETRLKRDFKHEGAVVNAFLELCSKEYDDIFSYRFIYRLRNFCQHCGWPIAAFHFSDNTDTLGRRIREFGAVINRDFLLDNFSWGKLAEEIAKLPREIDPVPHLRSAMLALKRIHVETTKLLFSKLKGSANVIVEMGKHLNGAGAPAILFIDGEVTNLSSIRFESFPIDVAEKIFNNDFQSLFSQDEVN